MAKLVKGGVGGAMMSGVKAYDSPAGAGAVGTRKRGSSGPGRTSRIEIELADNGGFMVTCYYKTGRERMDGPSNYREPSKHAYGDLPSALKFISKSLG